jgi:nucleoside-diphosphate-sugar epimerase
VLVTGAHGFIGRAAVAAIRATGRPVRGIDLADGDISRPGRWQQAFAGVDVVVHTAALVGMPAPPQPVRYWQVNTLGTHHVVQAAREAEVRRVVVLSSVVTFGWHFPDGVDETYPVQGTGTPYVDTKIAAEQVALAAHARGDVEVVVVRPADVVGPGSIWVTQALALLRTHRFAVPTTGVFSPVHVDDVVRGLLAAADSTAAAGQVITLSGGVGVPAGDFFDRVAALQGRTVPRLPTAVLLAAAAAQGRVAGLAGRRVQLSPDAVRYVGLRRGTYSIDRAAHLLGWRPQVSLEQGMQRLTQAERKQAWSTSA